MAILAAARGTIQRAECRKFSGCPFPLHCLFVYHGRACSCASATTPCGSAEVIRQRGHRGVILGRVHRRRLPHGPTMGAGRSCMPPHEGVRRPGRHSVSAVPQGRRIRAAGFLVRSSCWQGIDGCASASPRDGCLSWHTTHGSRGAAAALCVPSAHAWRLRRYGSTSGRCRFL